MAIPIVFNSVNINGQYTNTTVSIGEVQQTGWSAHSKNNFATGPLFGMNVLGTPINYNFDPDYIDTTIPNIYPVPSFQNQQV